MGGKHSTVGATFLERRKYLKKIHDETDPNIFNKGLGATAENEAKPQAIKMHIIYQNNYHKCKRTIGM